MHEGLSGGYHIARRSSQGGPCTEKKIGVILVAYEQIPGVARLTGEQVEDLRQVEKKTDTVMVAYKA